MIEVRILNKEFYKNGVGLCGLPLKDFGLPGYITKGSAAMDLICPRGFVLNPGQVELIGTGLSLWIRDPNVCALVLPRSGLGHKDGLVLGNLVGLVDSDYQGELMVSLWNRSEYVREYTAGARIAQIVFLPVVKPQLRIVNEFSDNTQRALGGFGSTGV